MQQCVTNRKENCSEILPPQELSTCDLELVNRNYPHVTPCATSCYFPHTYQGSFVAIATLFLEQVMYQNCV